MHVSGFKGRGRTGGDPGARSEQARGRLGQDFADAITETPPHAMQASPGRRLLRSLAALVLIGVFLAVVIGEQFAAVSASAFVNAPITTVRAPIGGTLTLEPLALGSPIERGALLGRIEDSRADTGRLRDLERQAKDLRATITETERRLTAVRVAMELARNRLHTYRDARTAQARARLAEASARVGAARARLGEARSVVERDRRLNARGLRTRADLEASEAAVTVAASALEAATRIEARERIALAAAEAGVFLGDGYNDEPASAQRIARHALEAQRLEAAATATRDRLAALGDRIDAERGLLAARTAATVQATGEGRLWQRLATDGEMVLPGQEILRLVDCASAVVTLSVTERVFNGLSIGTEARFRLTGDSRMFDGSVIRLAGPGARTLYERLAVAPGDEHLQGFDVTLSVPKLRRLGEPGCAVGRTGRAFFGARPLDGLRAFLG